MLELHVAVQKEISAPHYGPLLHAHRTSHGESRATELHDESDSLKLGLNRSKRAARSAHFAGSI